MKRLSFLRTLLGLPALPAALARSAEAAPIAAPVLHRVRIYYGFVRGFQYTDGYQMMDKLLPGLPLTLHREPENRYDAQAVRIEGLGCKLGYLPRESNRTIAHLLDAGRCLEAEITHVNNEAHDWQVLHLAVYELQPLPVADSAVPEPVYNGAYLENHLRYRTPKTAQAAPLDPDLEAWYAPPAPASGRVLLKSAGRLRDEDAARAQRETRRNRKAARRDYAPKPTPPVTLVVADRRHLPHGITLGQVLDRADATAQHMLDAVEGAEHLVVLQSNKLNAWADHLSGTVELLDRSGKRIVAWVMKG